MAQTDFATQTPVKTQVEALFDSLALEYVRDRERQFSFIAQKRIVIEMLSGVRGRLLEVGCGPAVMTPDLLAMEFEVQGIDVSREMIRRADLRMTGHPLAKRCKFATGDLERLQFPDAFFDAVLAMGVLEYLPDYAPALREIYRVLKPGGIAVLTVPNRVSAYHLARSGYQRLRRRRAANSYCHNPCVPWSLDRQLAAAGLSKRESRACNFIFFPLKELHAPASDALNRALMPISRMALARVLGAQYLVKAQRTGSQ
jgi:ubiquinone/menaquinone biosynthesis C-methylase UbiE